MGEIRMDQEKFRRGKKSEAHSGEFVTGVANKHTSLANSPITNSHTLDEP